MTGILIQGWCQYGNKYLLLLLSTVQGCWADGGTYTGEFVDGERNGQGTEKFTTGDEYTGEFKDGRFHGQGSYTSTELDGHVSTGKWEKGYLSAAPLLARTLTSGQRAVNQP